MTPRQKRSLAALAALTALAWLVLLVLILTPPYRGEGPLQAAGRDPAAGERSSPEAASLFPTAQPAGENAPAPASGRMGVGARPALAATPTPDSGQPAGGAEGALPARPTPTWTPGPLSTPPATPVAPSPQAQRLLLVDQGAQQMYVFEDDLLVRSIPVSTGEPLSNAFTPAWQGTVGLGWGTGPFRNSDLWSDYFWYLFPGPAGSILIHSVPYRLEGETKVYDRLEAVGQYPSSNGCIRVTPEDAAWLATWDPEGASIEILPYPDEITDVDTGRKYFVAGGG